MGRAVIVGGGVWLGFAAAALAQVTPAGRAGLAGERLLFTDGARQVEAIRREPVEPNRPCAVRLVYPDVGVAADAAVDRYALAAVVAGAEVDARWASLGVRPVRVLLPAAGIWLVESTGTEDGLAIADRLAGERGGPTLRWVVPNLWLARRHRAAPPNDPRFPGQWYLETLSLLDAWDYARGAPSTTVVVIDNGCDLDHPDLAAQLDLGRDVVSGDDDPSYVPGEPGNEHGTACAGLIAAATDNGVGIAGVCPGCRLRCVRLLGADGELVPLSADVDAFAFAADVGAAVVSNSWGFVDPIPAPAPLAEAINEVFDHGRDGRGALVLFAAGNDSHEIRADELLAVRGVLGVGAVNSYEEKTAFTNWGESIDLVAPTGTLATDIAGSDGGDQGDYTASFGGTSSACPVAAGVAGLLASAAPELTAAELAATLIATARPAPYAEVPGGHDPIYGWGIIDPAAALRSVLGITDEPPAPAGEGCDCASAAGLPWPLALLWRRRRRAA